MKYSLAKYICTIKIPSSLQAVLGESISIGGEGSYTDYIALHFNTDQWTTEGDATGGYIHNLSLDRTGTVEISISQLSDRVRQFISLVNIIYQSASLDESIIIEVGQPGNMVAQASDCVPTRIPDQRFEAVAGKQSWSFNAGKLTIY